MTKSDPTKDPEFQKVVQAFLRTKPKPRPSVKKRKAKKVAKRAKSESG
jgi:hypothetical protein